MRLGKYLAGAACALAIGTISPISIAAVSTCAAPRITVLQPISRTNLYFNDWYNAEGMMNAEVTPWSLETGRMGGWHTYLISTDRTFMCETPDNIFSLKTEKRIAQTGTCRRRTNPSSPPEQMTPDNSASLWNRDYDGVFSAHLLKTGAASWTVYAFNHGELKNTSGPADRFYPKCKQAPDIGFGKLPCTREYSWGSYSGFIGISRMPWTHDTLRNSTPLRSMGPIAWPSNGYAEVVGASKMKATDGGLRHPVSFVNAGFVYVYYEDLSQGDPVQGRGPGIKLIRAPVTPAGIDPQSFHAYYDGDFRDPALPPGFDSNAIHKFFGVKGPRASSIFPGEPQTRLPPTLGTGRSGRIAGEVFSFSVARINGTGLFLGVGTDLSKGTTLRLSRDLIHWSPATIIPGTRANYWDGIDLQKVPLLYPRLMNIDGDSNQNVSAQKFHVLGTQTAKRGSEEAKVVNSVMLRLDPGQCGISK